MGKHVCCSSHGNQMGRGGSVSTELKASTYIEVYSSVLKFRNDSQPQPCPWAARQWVYNGRVHAPQKRFKAAIVLSRKIDTACTSPVRGCIQTFGRKPHCWVHIPVWFCSNWVFCWEEWALKPTLKGQRKRNRMRKINQQHLSCKSFSLHLIQRQTYKDKSIKPIHNAFVLTQVYSQFAQLLSSAHVTNYYLLHSTSLQDQIERRFVRNYSFNFIWLITGNHVDNYHRSNIHCINK